MVFNLLSSPGSGKTALLERTVTDLRDRVNIGVIVGDLETDNDAERLRKTGAAYRDWETDRKSTRLNSSH